MWLTLLTWSILWQGCPAEGDLWKCNANPYTHFSTKTSYFAVGDTNPIDFPQDCTLDRFWLLARHGTRNPGDDGIIEIAYNGPRLQESIIAMNEKSQGSVCPEDIAAFRNWEFKLKLKNKSKLTLSGFKELKELAQRYKRDFSTILDIPYVPRFFRFRHTNKERTRRSAEGFAKGLFPGVANVVMEKPLNNDPILEFEDFCPKWKQTVDESTEKYEEREKFLAGEEMASVLDNVRSVVGSNAWTMEDVLIAYDICRFSKAWKPDDVAVWCTLFSELDLKILEYYEDLKYWYSNGYWKKVTSEMSCPLMKDIEHTFEYDGDLKAKFNFAHRQTVLPFLGLLGLYKDPYPLKHSNFQQALDREYKTSLIGSFSANVALALFSCPSEVPELKSTKKVLAMHQGKVIKIPRCSDELCDYEEFKEKFKMSLECNYDNICSLAASESSSFSVFLLISFSLFVLSITNLIKQ